MSWRQRLQACGQGHRHVETCHSLGSNFLLLYVDEANKALRHLDFIRFPFCWTGKRKLSLTVN